MGGGFYERAIKKKGKWFAPRNERAYSYKDFRGGGWGELWGGLNEKKEKKKGNQEKTPCRYLQAPKNRDSGGKGKDVEEKVPPKPNRKEDREKKARPGGSTLSPNSTQPVITLKRKKVARKEKRNLSRTRKRKKKQKKKK